MANESGRMVGGEMSRRMIDNGEGMGGCVVVIPLSSRAYITVDGSVVVRAGSNKARLFSACNWQQLTPRR